MNTAIVRIEILIYVYAKTLLTKTITIAYGSRKKRINETVRFEVYISYLIRCILTAYVGGEGALYPLRIRNLFHKFILSVDPLRSGDSHPTASESRLLFYHKNPACRCE